MSVAIQLKNTVGNSNNYLSIALWLCFQHCYYRRVQRQCLCIKLRRTSRRYTIPRSKPVDQVL